MARGVAVKLKSYQETIPRLLEVIKLGEEIKKHDKIVLKPGLFGDDIERSTNLEFLEQVLKFCSENKNPGAEIFIAEGCDGHDTSDIFDDQGYEKLAEKYGIGLIDLNQTETQEVANPDFLGFDMIHYPSLLLNSFVISLPKLKKDEESLMFSSLDNMLGAFPAKHYKGFFSSRKNKLRNINRSHQVHDIVLCKSPDFSIIDASEYGTLIAGQPLEMDKQAAKALGHNWEEIDHLKLLEETLSGERRQVLEEELPE